MNDQQLENLAKNWRNLFSVFLTTAKAAVQGNPHAMHWMGNFFYEEMKFELIGEIRSVLKSVSIHKKRDGRIRFQATLGQFGTYIKDSRESEFTLSPDEARFISFDKAMPLQCMKNALHWYQLAYDNGDKTVKVLLNQVRENMHLQRMNTLKKNWKLFLQACGVLFFLLLFFYKKACH